MKMMRNSTIGSSETPPVTDGPADDRRQGAGGAADDDVLRRRALEPHRIDDDVEDDGEREQGRGDDIDQKPEHDDGKAASVRPKARASPGRSRPAGIGRPAVRDMRASISASYHMFSAPAAPAPTAMQISAVRPMTGWI